MIRVSVLSGFWVWKDSWYLVSWNIKCANIWGSFVRGTWSMPKIRQIHQTNLIYQCVHTHGSKHASFVHPNQHGMKHTCQNPPRPRPHLHTQISRKRPWTRELFQLGTRRSEWHENLRVENCQHFPVENICSLPQLLKCRGRHSHNKRCVMFQTLSSICWHK